MRTLAVCCAALLLAACSGGEQADPSTATASPSASATVDCVLAKTAIGDYRTAVEDLAVSVQANDSMSSVAAADAMLYALDQLMPAVEATGDPGLAFASQAWAVASLVKTTAANGTSLQQVVPRLTQAFQDDGYRSGAAAIEAFVTDGCPTASAAP